MIAIQCCGRIRNEIFRRQLFVFTHSNAFSALLTIRDLRCERRRVLAVRRRWRIWNHIYPRRSFSFSFGNTIETATLQSSSLSVLRVASGRGLRRKTVERERAIDSQNKNNAL